MLLQRRRKFLPNVASFNGYAIFVTFETFKFAAENRVNFQRGDWTGVKWSSQSRRRRRRRRRRRYFNMSGNDLAPKNIPIRATAIKNKSASCQKAYTNTVH